MPEWGWFPVSLVGVFGHSIKMGEKRGFNKVIIGRANAVRRDSCFASIRYFFPWKEIT